MKTLTVAAIRCSLMVLAPMVRYAISAQWNLDRISGDWNTVANWTPKLRSQWSSRCCDIPDVSISEAYAQPKFR